MKTEGLTRQSVNLQMDTTQVVYSFHSCQKN